MSHSIDTHVGARLRLLRLNSQLSQTELGTRVGVTFLQIQKYESGTDRISASKLLEFAHILSVPVHEFFAGAATDENDEDAASTFDSHDVSRLDLDIVRLLSQIDDTCVKQHIRGLLEAFAQCSADRDPPR